MAVFLFYGKNRSLKYNLYFTSHVYDICENVIIRKLNYDALNIIGIFTLSRRPTLKKVIHVFKKN